jgi:hypothetical protein
VQVVEEHRPPAGRPTHASAHVFVGNAKYVLGDLNLYEARGYLSWPRPSANG